MNIPTYIVDTFTSLKFKGNPTAICTLENNLGSKIMHKIAAELNFPVTAFIAIDKNGVKYKIRYFTITGEIPACGHATLASSKIIFELTNKSKITFETIENTQIKTYFKDDIIFMLYSKFETHFFYNSKYFKKFSNHHLQIDSILYRIRNIIY